MAANLGVERFKTVPLFHAPAHILVVGAQREPLAHAPGPAPSPANSQSRCQMSPPSRSHYHYPGGEAGALENLLASGLLVKN